MAPPRKRKPPQANKQTSISGKKMASIPSPQGNMATGAVGISILVLLSVYLQYNSSPSVDAGPNQSSNKEDDVLFTAGSFDIVEIIDHDSSAFTQGLLVEAGKLYESTGLYKESSLRLLNRHSGNVLEKTMIKDSYFGEGIVVVDDTIIMLTWKSKVGIVFNISTLEEIDSFSFDTTRGEGWGITNSAVKQELIVSDGSDVLHVWDSTTRQEIRQIKVEYQGKPVKAINELEYDPETDLLLANIWYQEVIIGIDMTTGKVREVHDMTPFRTKTGPRAANNEDVLNGIAYDRSTGDYYFTGKLWSKIFRGRRRKG